MALIQWDMSSYNTVRAAILLRASQGLGYDYDGHFGYQCWDLGANWYGSVGRQFRTKNSFTGAGGADSYVLTTWTYQPAYQSNSSDPFTAVTNISEIKRGDMIIWGNSSEIAVSGHNAFADEDYNNGKTTIRALGQNQQDSNFETGHIPTLNDLSKNGILGAFRYKPWFGDNPTPPFQGAILIPNGSKIVILHHGCQKKRSLIY